MLLSGTGIIKILPLAVVAFLTTVQCDLPCRARDLGIEGRSIVCVCDASYCDTITRDEPTLGGFVEYTSSKSGKRFQKNHGNIEVGSPFRQLDQDTEQPRDWKFWTRVSLALNISATFQSVEGFGGSVTDAAAINWRKLSEVTQDKFIKSYFSGEGLEYNMIRVPIGGADFSTYPYTYNEFPVNDAKLTNFSLSNEDYLLKLPMIKSSQAVATNEIKITASTWSPPVWMKTNGRITGFAQLRPEFYQTYADYHLKFIEEYSKEDVKIWAITTTNEPINGIVPVIRFNSMGWFPSDLGRWIANNLGPTIRNSRFNDTLILAIDDQRYLLHFYLYGINRGDPKAMEYIDGIAIHYYGNFAPPALLSNIQKSYPDKILLSTEACEGPLPWDEMKVKVGSWTRAARYTKSIMQDLNNFVVGWIDWNLCLDENGGPNWADNFVDAPILVYPERDEFIKQPMYYAMGHFSKFIPRGSRRIEVNKTSFSSIENVAFITPDGNIVMVLHNKNNYEITVNISLGYHKYIEIKLEPESIKTLDIRDTIIS